MKTRLNSLAVAEVSVLPRVAAAAPVVTPVVVELAVPPIARA